MASATSDTPRARSRRLRLRVAALVAGLAAGVSAAAAPAGAQAASGEVGFLRNATSAFDSILVGSSTAQRQWMAGAYSRMRGYPPFFDRALGWAPPAQFYKDLYAIYNPSERALIDANPSWVLRDAAGKPLFIDYDCGAGSCPQYAADVGDPGWRAHWIEEARADLAKGYAGIFIDDVNLEMRVSDGSRAVRPIDPRTGSPMTDADWRRYMAEFVEEIRAAFPNAEIAHNPHWWLPHSDPYVRRQVDAADFVELERGFNDRGIRGGGGTFGFETYLAHVDWLHGRGKSVIYEPYNLDATSREFELASYFLVQAGEDLIASDHLANPGNFWAGWETDLGPALGGRYAWKGLLRRDFERGVVLVNQPDAPSRTVELPAGLTDLEGAPVSTLTLGSREGAVLRGAGGQAAGGAAAGGTGGVGATGSGGSTGGGGGSAGADEVGGGEAGGGGSGTAAGSETGSSPELGPDGSKRAEITVSPRRRKVRRGRAIVLRGVAPAAASVEIQALEDGAWRTLASDEPSSDTFRVSLPARRSGQFRFRAAVPGAGASRAVRVRVL